MDTILEWATQFYCASDDHEILADLLPLRARVAGEDPAQAEQAAAGTALEGDSEPLHVALYRLRRAATELGPSYLGLDETEEVLDSQQPWASPLNLQQMAKRTAPSGGQSSGQSGAPLEPFSSPFSSPQRRVRPRTLPSADRAAAAALDVPAMVRRLITVENTRRRYAAEFLLRKNAQGSVAEQSERWQHHFAKRNIAAETKFENILIALKELVVLRAVVDSRVVRIGELRRILARLDDARQPAPRRLDVAQCLAVLNLMFPLDPLQTDARTSPEPATWQQRYACPLRHVPNPRMQLHQLLCEAEAWVRGDERVTASVGSPALQDVGSLLDQLPCVDGNDNDGDGDERGAKRARTSSTHRAASCPTWKAAARGLAWGQLRQSCLSYLRDTEQKIAEQHQAVHPWTAGPDAAAAAAAADGASERVPEYLDGLGDEGLRMSRSIQSENGRLLEEVMRQVGPTSTVLERIARHSRLMKLRFSPYAAYDALARPGPASS
ncbi:hypothetical protein IWQ57_001894 [Coemansia nantahalensis]|uniref:Uncharacterized protein n=1 Tax=Coemansia nantahalensis TaxID=2789366 RepID=A0ACC1K2M8_9FUNG|nr:hypothetical protein IWQ57_001894 [Coemansia nantahalensis]